MFGDFSIFGPPKEELRGVFEKTLFLWGTSTTEMLLFINSLVLFLVKFSI